MSPWFAGRFLCSYAKSGALGRREGRPCQEELLPWSSLPAEGCAPEQSCQSSIESYSEYP